ncbi:hypothetical protein B0H14DRAFT_2273039, partial [Mycena olivaceomarginata]
MLILFKPWRTFQDLKDTGDKWADVYDWTTFSSYATRIIANMQVERECKDARDAFEALRKAGKAKPLLPSVEGGRASKDVEDFAAALEGDVNLMRDDYTPTEGDMANCLDHDSLKPQEAKDRATEDVVKRILDSAGIWKDRHVQSAYSVEDHTYVTTNDVHTRMKEESKLMSSLGKDKRPLMKPPQGEPSAKRRKLDPGVDVAPQTSLEQFRFEEHTIFARGADIDTVTPEEHLDDIIRTSGIGDNAEQLRALRIIAEHFMFGLEEQLLLYIAGVGGASKSFVIKTVVEFFRRCGVSDQMMLSAP